MKKYLCLFIALVCINLSLRAAPGDTTWVQANNVQLTYYGSFDTTIAFPAPGTTYRKIYMIVTLGKYMCAGYPSASVPYCGDWDYTIQNYLMTPGGDTLEISRLITPYANNGAPRTPWTWTQPYVFDVTDYSALMHDSATMRLFFSGYSGGFTANIKFAFIEGTPDRNVVGIQKVWGGSYSYGDTVGGDVNDINTHFTPVSFTAPAGTVNADLKFTVTGHGSDTINQCCEFASHNFKVMLNGSSIATQTVWRGDCGLNELYPQSGTWPLTRANWCPGALVYAYFYQLPGITAGSAYNVGITFDPYQEVPSSDGYGLYTTFGTMIYYGAINKTHDASIESIIAPTNDPNHFRENPIAGNPVLHIHNSGSAAIDSVSFQYGVVGSPMQTYTWIGNLAPLADTEINLAAVPELDSVAGLSGTYNFIAAITAVNGVADDDQTNDTMRSQFIAAPKFPSSFLVQMYTSNIPAGTSTTVAETSWAIYDMNNLVVMQRSNCGFNTLYNDTVNNLPTGYYQFVVYDSFYYGDCFGLQSFLFEYTGSGYVPGYLNVKKLNAAGSLISMNGYNYGRTEYIPSTGAYDLVSGSSYNNDFGQGYSQWFYVVNTTESVKNVTAANTAMSVFPNPARDVVTVDITGMQQVNGKIDILDELGRVVSSTVCTSGSQQINVASLLSGVYTVLYIGNGSDNKLQTKLLITK